MVKRIQRKIKGFNDKLPEPDGEECQRCGEWGEDRRTLWHACFYAMSELNVPFKQVQVKGHLCEQTGTEELKHFNHEVPVFAEPDDSKIAHGYPFYTLRVCKDCRASWMRSIVEWFNHSDDKPESCGSGIFIRRQGQTVEITHEEWEQLQKEKENEH